METDIDITNPLGPPAELRAILDCDPPDLWPRIQAKLPGWRLAGKLRRQEADRARVRKVQGRKPTKDYTQATDKQLVIRIATLRDERRIKNIETLKAHRKELRRLQKIL